MSMLRPSLTAVSGALSSVRARDADTMQMVGQLAAVSKIDTIYRDIYLHRARTLLTPMLSEPEYRDLQKERQALDELLRQTRSAVAHHQWPRVSDLVGHIRRREQIVESKRAVLELAAAVYDAREVSLAPFGPGLPGVGTRSSGELAQLRDGIVTALIRLERDDRDAGPFYAARRSCVQALALGIPSSESVPIGPDQASMEDEATRALDRKDLDRLERLAQRMQASPAQSPIATACPPLGGATFDLARPWPEEAHDRARRLGLIPVHADFDPGPAEYLRCCCVWLPTVPDRPLDLDTKASHACTCRHACPPSVGAALKDTLDLLIAHPFVNSAGERYLPGFAAETLLVEDFPEGEAFPPGEGLPELLGLQRRTAVSRLDLEARLLHHGPEIVRDVLGLEPCDFRLACIPFDVYSRLAATYGWGLGTRWTHFDGYQVWKGGRLRALVGGDVRYGGRHHICSIGVDDARDEVVVRLAVVRRERFMVTGHAEVHTSAA